MPVCCYGLKKHMINSRSLKPQTFCISAQLFLSQYYISVTFNVRALLWIKRIVLLHRAAIQGSVDMSLSEALLQCVSHLCCCDAQIVLHPRLLRHARLFVCLDFVFSMGSTYMTWWRRCSLMENDSLFMAYVMQYHSSLVPLFDMIELYKRMYHFVWEIL